MTSEFWSGRKVLVTGADGFIGSHLVERLVELGARVTAFCFYNSNGSLGWLDQTDPRTRSEIVVRLGDIRDARLVEESARDIDVIFHLAALISIPYSYQAPESFIDTNVKGTLNVLEAARRCRTRRVIQTSTSEVYGTPHEVPIRESHPLHGQSPYSASKIAADMLCEAYHRSFEVPVVTLRPFNTYGPRQSLRAVLPTILVQLLRGQTEIALGRLDPRRDLTFVADTVDGFVRAAEVPGIDGETIQLGTGETVSIGDLFHTACRVLGVSAKIIQKDERLRPDKSEVLVLLSDPSLAKERLGWVPTVDLEAGLLRTANWLRTNLDRYALAHYVP